jgi:P-type Cu2+ transporter
MTHSPVQEHHRQGAHAHDASVDHTGHEKTFFRRFWVSLGLSVPVLVLSPMLQMLLGFSWPYFPGSAWIGAGCALLIFAYGGFPFISMAVPEVRKRRPGMMLLISLAITVSFLYSVFALFVDPTGGFFWEMATLIDIMLLGHWLEMRSVRHASGALDELARLLPDTAERILSEGATEKIPLHALRAGDMVLVRPGAGIPADGEVLDGRSSVNQAMVTGESLPVEKTPGSPVIGGTINGDGSMRVRVTAAGEETALAGIMRLVAQAQQSKSATQVLADRAAGWLFYVALSVAALTAAAWSLLQGLSLEVLERVVTVLVIACPHALGLAVPLVVAISTALGARQGVLVRDRLALEAAREIDIVIFDKTGTLTKGQFGLSAAATIPGWEEDQALALAAAVEGDSEHLIARGMRGAVEQRALRLPSVSEFEALKGRGIRASWQGKTVHVGGPRLLEMLGVGAPETLARFAADADRKGHSVVYLCVDGRPVASFSLSDVVRRESTRAVKELQAMGMEVAMLSGDSSAVAKAVADEVGIRTVFAEVLPDDKERKVKELQDQGKRVAMVGDGVNDAPALAGADVGLAIGSGTDVAIESAGIILMQSNPLDVVKVFRLSRATWRKMIQNLFWATGYNIVALPLAAGVLAPWGITLSPAVGALLMSLSTIVVALNAQLLRGVRLATPQADLARYST